MKVVYSLLITSLMLCAHSAAAMPFFTPLEVAEIAALYEPEAQSQPGHGDKNVVDHVTNTEPTSTECSKPKESSRQPFKSTDCRGDPGLIFQPDVATHKTLQEGKSACAQLSSEWDKYCKCEGKFSKYNKDDPATGVFERVGKCDDNPNMTVHCGYYDCTDSSSASDSPSLPVSVSLE